MIDKNKPMDADVSQAASGPEDAEAAADENAPIDTTIEEQQKTDLTPDKNTPIDITIEEQTKTGLTRDKNTPID
ncbi:hypothetical protein [Mucilaginibacter sp. L3T2-6]|uniref:hypothetical protein n=1 Tax=Mucilaginibacter sp. L3T2-6 TaxID=3062491 RepID=UPI00267705D6|nr:hypothetical protein [Mucilaginibacter sp. L3T2-6]MDO3641562.1 hypothetical protein [Mucilaginibacter sp. L3T2-6]MDV6214056.1 hypothetical protein [Mucilaginibacter sp. L3T2-6]